MDGAAAFEMGYMLGQGRPIAGYSLDQQDYAARLINLHDAFDAPLAKEREHFRAPDGLLVENFGLGDSLMLATAAGVTLAPDFESAVRWIRRLVGED